jgi:electron transport complex protein RnfE
MKSIKKELIRGVITENPILVLALGLCPALGVSTSVENGLGMGIAATFVLIASNVLVSILKNVIPAQVRIPSYIIIIATFVTIVKMAMEAYLPELYASLGLFIPLIVVNCVILGRAEAFASKNSVWDSLIDGVVMGLGFTVALVILSAIREILGANKLMGLEFIPNFKPMTIFILAPGGFFTIAFVIALINYFKGKEAK